MPAIEPICELQLVCMALIMVITDVLFFAISSFRTEYFLNCFKRSAVILISQIIIIII
jgi:hypothetical protein